MREHFHLYKRNHRRAIFAAGMFVLYFLTIGVAGWLGMNPNGIWIIGGLFVIVTLLMEATFEQY
jgi:hypothetical protein